MFAALSQKRQVSHACHVTCVVYISQSNSEERHSHDSNGTSVKSLMRVFVVTLYSIERCFFCSLVQTERIKELFDLAVQRQTKEMNDNIHGCGIDNHLMGLRYAAMKAGEPIPDIFMDETYAMVNHFALSTSQVSH